MDKYHKMKSIIKEFVKLILKENYADNSINNINTSKVNNLNELIKLINDSDNLESLVVELRDSDSLIYIGRGISRMSFELSFDDDYILKFYNNKKQFNQNLIESDPKFISILREFSPKIFFSSKNKEIIITEKINSLGESFVSNQKWMIEAGMPEELAYQYKLIDVWVNNLFNLIKKSNAEPRFKLEAYLIELHYELNIDFRDLRTDSCGYSAIDGRPVIRDLGFIYDE